MADKLLDTSQLVSGIAIMLSFFAGYKYATKGTANSEEEAAAAASSSSDREKVRMMLTMSVLCQQ